ncbi:MAG: BMP family protein [Ardenticatenaceae bacterium]
MKYALKFMMLLLLLLPLAACGGDRDDGVFRIAVIMPSAITDVAFSQSMWDGLNAIQAEMGGESALELAYSDGMFKVSEAAEAIRDYADQGYDLIIAHGSQYGTSVSEIAPDFPETSFAWGTATDTFGQPNIFAYQAHAQEGGYVNGVLAGLMSESGIIGITGPVEAGDAKLYVDGFINGAKSVNPDIQVKISYTGSFSDIALMSEAANTHIAAGADILTGSSQSVIGAIEAAKEKGGVFWFGTQANQTSFGSEVVIASQAYDWTGPIKDMIEKHNVGTLGGESYTLTFENDGLKLEYNPDISVSDDAKRAAQQAIEGIKSASINPLP